MKAGDILRVINKADGTDYFYLINEIQMGDICCESVIIMQSLSRRENQSDRAGKYHQVPYPLIDDSDNYEIYTKI